MSAADNIYHRVFIFSQTQKDNIMEIEKSRGNVSPVFGKVVVKGTPKVYTDIINSRANIRYPDSRVLIEGDIRSIKYTETKIGR